MERSKELRTMNISETFTQQSEEFNTLSDLAQFTFHFLTDNFADAEFALLTHQVDEIPLRILNSTHLLRDITSYRLQLEQRESPDRIFISHNNFFDTIYIFVCERKPPQPLHEVLNRWQAASRQLYQGYDTGHEDCRTQMGDLIAQLLHDIHSLMDCAKEIVSPIYDKRQTYQNTVNKNLLFFVRDLELFKTDFELEPFFKDTLSVMDITPASIDISIDPALPMINADMELLSKAVNEIIKNAIHATDNNISQVSIRVTSISLHSPFLDDPWLRIVIKDRGKGISDDFLPYVKKPFFTTDKYLGHSGFGLAIANKIIRAHEGFIKIASVARKQTQVSIYLRGLKHAQEK